MIIICIFSTSTLKAAEFNLPNMQVSSNAFKDGGIIPIRYTSHGDNIQPDFLITGAPENTVSFAIIFHDIDVALGGNTADVTHWLVWNIASPIILEGKLSEGSVEGKNIMGKTGYMGSGAPFKDRFHHYVFEFYALSENLNLPEGSSRAELESALQGKVVAKTAYVGLYANAK